MIYRRTVGFVGLFLATILLAVFRLDIRTDISDFFFSGDDQDAAFIINQFSADNLQRRTILSVAHPGIDATEAQAFIESFRRSLQAIPQVERVWSSALNEESIEQLLDIYVRQKVHLRSLNPEKEIPVIFEATPLQQRVAGIKSALIGPAPRRVKALIQQDPMLLSLDWLAQVQSNFGPPSKAHDNTILFLETLGGGMGSGAQENVQRQISQIFEQLNLKAGGRYRLLSTGVPVFAAAIKAEVSRDIQRVSTLSMLAIMLLFIVVFRAPKALLLTSLMLLTTISGAVLVTQWVFGYVHGLTLALGATLIGVCIDYYIHAMVHGGAEGVQHSLRSIQKIWPSLMLGGATTLLGYFALAASGFPGLQQIALFSASGIVIALLMARYVIPDFMQHFNLRLHAVPGSAQLLAMTQHISIKIGLLLIAIVCFLIGVMNIQWSDDLQSLSPDLSQLKANDSQIRASMTSIEPGRFILVEAADTETALQRSETVNAVLESMRAAGSLDHYFPVFPWIASKQLQARNTTSWNALLDDAQRHRWTSTLDSGGLSAKYFPALLPADKEYLTLDALKNSPIAALLARQIMQQDGRAMVVTWLGKHDVNKLKQAVQGLPDTRYFSQRESIDALAAEYRHKSASMLAWGLFAILALLIWRFRSLRQALKVLSPAILSIAFVLGISGILGNPLNMLHLIGLLLTAAICVDYGIFFAENRTGKHLLTFQAITASALTSAASFASLGAAENPALQALAWTVAPGILIGFLLCPVLLQPTTLPSEQSSL